MIDIIQYVLGLTILNFALTSLASLFRPNMRTLIIVPLIALVFGLYYQLFFTQVPDNYYKEFGVDRIVD